MALVLTKVLPIILLCVLGVIIRKTDLLKQSAIDGIKLLVVQFALPAVLFRTFLTMAFQKEYILISLAMFVLLLLLFFVGIAYNRISVLAHVLTLFLMTGFAFGLLGIPLFSIAFGEENLGIISVLGFGHEVFIWFVLITLLRMKLSGEGFGLSSVKGFIKSPLIISILTGLSLNLLGISRLFETNPLLKGVDQTLQYMGSLATPLILLTIGYGLRFKKEYIIKSIGFVLLRFITVFTVGYIFKFIVFDRLIGQSVMFDNAYFTFLVLPGLFSLPIFVGKSGKAEDEELANNVIMLNTLVSLGVFLIAMFIIV